MGRSGAAITLPDVRIADAEALWYDLERWPSFVEGFKHVVIVGGGWPAVGAVLFWECGTDGRGRVTRAGLSPAQRGGAAADGAAQHVSGWRPV